MRLHSIMSYSQIITKLDASGVCVSAS